MMCMTSLDTILGTAGVDLTDLTATVTQHRSMSTNVELVLADQAPEQVKHVPEVGLEPDSSRPRRYASPSIIGKKFIGETMSGKYNTSLTHRLWTWLLVLGPLAAGTGIFLGSQKVGSMCGSVFRANNVTAAYYDSLGGVGAEAACSQSIAAAAIPTWILIVLGIILALAAVIIRTVSYDGPISVTGSSGPRRRRPRRPGPS